MEDAGQAPTTGWTGKGRQVGAGAGTDAAKMSDNGGGTSGSTGSSAKGWTQAEDEEGTTTIPSGLHRN